MTGADFFGGWVNLACKSDIKVDLFGALVGAPDSMGTSVGCKNKNKAACVKPKPVPDPPNKPDQPKNKPEDTENKASNASKNKPKNTDKNKSTKTAKSSNTVKNKPTNTDKSTSTKAVKPTITEKNKPASTDKNKPTNTDKNTSTNAVKPTVTEKNKPTNTDKNTSTNTVKPTVTEKNKPTNTNKPTSKPVETASKTTKTSSTRTSTSDEDTETDCAVCGSGGVKRAAEESRWGVMYGRAAPQCAKESDSEEEQDDQQSCEIDISGLTLSERGDGLSTKLLKAQLTTKFNVKFGRYAPCGKAKLEPDIDKYFYFTSDSCKRVDIKQFDITAPQAAKRLAGIDFDSECLHSGSSCLYY